jgi:hypothetical protein
MKLPCLISLAVFFTVFTAAAGTVEILPAPEGGIQPRALAAPDGSLHLVWYQGLEKGGDVFYARRVGGRNFTVPVRVNSEPGSAIAAGTIRGAQAVVGKKGRVHVVWNGAKAVQDAPPQPLFYSRLADDGKSFEPQRAMSGEWIMDGGGAVAADAKGRVYVFYHGGIGMDELTRRVLVRSSTDEGRTFDSERIISPESSGVCGCCAMQAIATDSGTVIALYRTVSEAGRDRDLAALTSKDGGKTFVHSIMDRWAVATCPMSSMSLAASKRGILAAWEREGQIYVAPAGGGKFAPVSPDGKPKQRKHPVLAVKGDEVMVAWTEGTGWQKGGNMAWQILEGGKLQPAKASGRAPGVKMWSFVSTATTKDGFVIVQ